MGNNNAINSTKKHLLIGMGVFVILLLSGCSGKSDATFLDVKQNNMSSKQTLSIAACPTFWDVLYPTDLFVRETQSTSESLHLLKGGYVQYALAGRTPKPGEFQGDYQILGSGYSFLSQQTMTISDEELQTMNFYTDLDDLETIKNIFGIQYLEKMENIYEHIHDNIIITSRENTDYNKADIVHVMHPNGERYIESRIPILYCKEQCDKEMVKKIKNILYNK